ncbi:unnamed protein product, partial [Effrenium voratum]
EQGLRERIDLLSSELLQSTSEVQEAAAEAARIESSQSHAAEELQLVRASEQEEESKAKAAEDRATVLDGAVVMLKAEVAAQEEVAERVRGQLEQLEARSAADKVRESEELRSDLEESKSDVEQGFRERIDLLSSELLQSEVKAAEALRIESSQSHAAEELQLMRASEQEEESKAKAAEDRAQVLNVKVAAQEEEVERVRGQLEQLEERSAADGERALRSELEESREMEMDLRASMHQKFLELAELHDARALAEEEACRAEAAEAGAKA